MASQDETLQRKYRVRIAVFLLAVVLSLVLVNAGFKAINTIRYLDLIEAERNQWQRPADVIAALDLRQGNRVADLGSGAGYFALKLSQSVGPSGEVLAVDIRKLPLVFLAARAFSKGIRNIRVHVGDPDEPGLPAAGLDAVLIANTYHEFEHPGLMLEHVRAALRFNGRLVVLDRSAEGSEPGDPMAHKHEVPAAVVAEQLRTKGFEVLELQEQFIVRPNGERWWLLVARKRTTYAQRLFSRELVREFSLTSSARKQRRRVTRYGKDSACDAVRNQLRPVDISADVISCR